MRNLKTFPGPEGSNPNFDENKVPDYKLPDLLLSDTGLKINSSDEWRAGKRNNIVGLYEKYIFGTAPVNVSVRCVELKSADINECPGVRLQIFNMYLCDKDQLITQFVVFTPAKITSPVPAFLGPNILGNQSITGRFNLPLATSWVFPRPAFGIDSDGYATTASVGVHASRWPLENIIHRGYGLITFHCADLYPDRADGSLVSIQPLFDGTPGHRYSWGALSTWAWGMSKVLDCVGGINSIDEKKIISVGHSRLGKAALWAAGLDTRFAAVIANQSGEGGAAISRRKFGERVSDIVRHFPHWFSPSYSEYSGKEETMPVDSHALISLIAPRPVYIASAQDDLWSDPRGEFAGLAGASKIWSLHGVNIELPETIPDVDRPSSGRLSYHIRRGGHDITPYDWNQFLNFTDKYIK